MKFNFFKKTKVENAIDPDLLLVLPKSGKSVSLQKLINDAYEKDQDPAMEKHDMNDADGESAKSHAMANMDHMVKMHDGSYMKLKDMMSKHKDMMDEMEDLKKAKKDSKEKELDLKVEPADVDAQGDLHNDEEMEENDHEEEVHVEEKKAELKDDLEHPEDCVYDAEDPQEDKEAKKKALQLAEHEEKEIEEAKQKNKKKNQINEGKLRAARLKNAHLKAFDQEEAPVIELSMDRVARGKVKYGS